MIELRSYPVKAPEELQVARLIPLCAAEGVPRVVRVSVVQRYDGILASAWIPKVSSTFDQTGRRGWPHLVSLRQSSYRQDRST